MRTAECPGETGRTLLWPKFRNEHAEWPDVGENQNMWDFMCFVEDCGKHSA